MKTNRTANPHPKHFTPSQNDLLAMLANAEGKFEAGREQAALKREAKECAAMEAALVAEAKQRNRNFWSA